MKYSKSMYISDYAPNNAERHPMLIHGAGVATIAAACNSASNALWLALTMLTLCVGMSVVYMIEREEYIQPMRTIVYFLPSSIIAFLCGLAINALSPITAERLGPYLPLLAADSIVLARLEEDAPFVPSNKALPEAISLWWLYAVLALPIGVLREILGSGSVFGMKIPLKVVSEAMTYPFAGFIMLGFALAIVQAKQKRQD